MRKRKKLLWQLFPSYLIVILISLFAVAWYSSNALRNFYIKQVKSDLEERGRLFGSQIAPFLDPIDEKAVDNLCKKSGLLSSTRITVILPSGKVIGDSNEDPAVMDTHVDRPEFIEALKDSPGISKRYSLTLKKNFLYVGIPLKKNNQILAVVRTSTPADALERTIRNIQGRIAIAGLIIALIAAIICLFVSRRITFPLEQIKAWAKTTAQGEFKSTPPPMRSEEIGALSDTVHLMAMELRDRINTVTRQKSEFEAVLSSMVEAVIAVNTAEQIIITNRAAARMFSFDIEEAHGRSFQEMIRNSALHNFVKASLESETPQENDIQHAVGEDRVLKAHGTMLRDSEGQRMGALIVLNDVSRLHKLENIRRDFAANVSHEIQTPLTAIKGFVETLLDGGVDKEKDLERFLKIISKHVERLQAIIEDLLSLSRLEKETERHEITLSETGLFNVLESARQVCHTKAEKKKIDIELNCSKNIAARLDSQLFEQAIVNLLDNAIKYSEGGSKIEVVCKSTDDFLSVSIIDEGCGIESRHLPRLFERFYRADKARSRQLGGTGLGLAIVKHIVQAHNGKVSVESRIGEGSTFTISLPQADGSK
jgi:two-component system phosphate regulon sensor histidine kinase PhoR